MEDIDKQLNALKARIAHCDAYIKNQEKYRQSYINDYKNCFNKKLSSFYTNLNPLIEIMHKYGSTTPESKAYTILTLDKNIDDHNKATIEHLFPLEGFAGDPNTFSCHLKGHLMFTKAEKKILEDYGIEYERKRRE